MKKVLLMSALVSLAVLSTASLAQAQYVVLLTGGAPSAGCAASAPKASCSTAASCSTSASSCSGKGLFAKHHARVADRAQRKADRHNAAAGRTAVIVIDQPAAMSPPLPAKQPEKLPQPAK